MMTSADLIELSGGLLAVGGVVVAMMKGGFCAREMPVWLRVWMFVSIAMLGSRLLTRDNASLTGSEYWVSMIYLNIGVVVVVAAAWSVAVTIGPGGDRCPARSMAIPNIEGRRGHVAVGMIGLIALIAIVLILFW